MSDVWKVVVEPQGNNPGTQTAKKKKGVVDRAKEAVGSSSSSEPEQGLNEGGMIVYVTNANGAKQEVSRVGFVRRNSKNPKVPFDKQLRAEIDKARAAVGALNEQFVGTGELQ